MLVKACLAHLPQLPQQLPGGHARRAGAQHHNVRRRVSLAEAGLTPDVVVPVEEEVALEIYYGTMAAWQDPQIQAAIKALN